MVQEIYSMYCTNKNMLPIWELEGSSVQLQGVTKTECPGILAFFYTRIQGYLVKVKVLIYPWSVTQGHPMSLITRPRSRDNLDPYKWAKVINS